MGKKSGQEILSLNHFFSGITDSSEFREQYSTCLQLHVQASTKFNRIQCTGMCLELFYAPCDIELCKDTNWLLKDGQTKGNMLYFVVFVAIFVCGLFLAVAFLFPVRNLIIVIVDRTKGGPRFPLITTAVMYLILFY